MVSLCVCSIHWGMWMAFFHVYNDIAGVREAAVGSLLGQALGAGCPDCRFAEAAFCVHSLLIRA